jgi:transposase-like protein
MGTGIGQNEGRPIVNKKQINKKQINSYSAEFKLDAVNRMAGAPSITGLAKELGIRRKFLYQWRHQFEAEGKVGLERRRGRPPGSKSAAVKPPGPSAAEQRIAELERLLGRKQLEVDFLKRAFEHVRGVVPRPTSSGDKESIEASKPRSRSKGQR